MKVMIGALRAAACGPSSTPMSATASSRPKMSASSIPIARAASRTRQIVLLRALAIYLSCLLTQPGRARALPCRDVGQFLAQGPVRIDRPALRRPGRPASARLGNEAVLGQAEALGAAPHPPASGKGIVRHRAVPRLEGFHRGRSPRARRSRWCPTMSPPASPPAVRSSERGYILFLGLIGLRKGAFDLIRAFARVRDFHPQARLVLGGNGQVAEAGKLAADLRIADSVILPAGSTAMRRPRCSGRPRSMFFHPIMRACR